MALSDDVAPEYVVQHVRDALAKDDRVGQLDIEVTVAGRRIQLAGHVQTGERRAAIEEVVGEVARDWEIHNGIVVDELHESGSVENLP